MAQKTGLGDGPDAKRISIDIEDQHDEESGFNKNVSVVQLEVMQQDGSKDTDCDSLHANHGSMSHSIHVAPYTGNGCAPSLESFMFQQTPAGSQLCSWMSHTESKTSKTDILPASELDKDPKSQVLQSKCAIVHSIMRCFIANKFFCLQLLNLIARSRQICVVEMHCVLLPWSVS